VEHGELVARVLVRRLPCCIGVRQPVGELAEAGAIIPDIDIRYNRVRLALVTHDAGGLTTNDFDMATKINESAKA